MVIWYWSFGGREAASAGWVAAESTPPASNAAASTRLDLTIWSDYLDRQPERSLVPVSHRASFLLEFDEALLELFEPLLHRRQVAEHHRRFPPVGVRERGRTGDERAGLHRLQHRALRADDDLVADRDVPGHATLPRHHHVVADRRAAGDADLRREQHAAADRHAVRDVHQVVDLRAGADARLADRRAIDRRVRADLDVVFDHDVAVLRDLEVRAVLLPREAEAVAADDDAVVQRHAVADDDALANRRPASG